MLKERFLFAALCLTVWTAVAPAMASARPLRADRASQWQTAVSALMTWWGVFDDASERGTLAARRTDRTKNGCGIDPNGTPLCETRPGGGMGGSGLQSGTEDPADSGN